KFRGAYNALVTLEDGERRRGVLTYSSGNHAQAISLAGRLLGIAVTAVMPTDAPLPKRLATEVYGETVVTYDPEREIREEVAARLREESGAVLNPPYDHPAVIAGQGTAALELIEETGGLVFL